MTVDRLTPDAARVLQMLAAGKTTQEVADASSWLRERVVALARAQKGWILSAETDTVSDPGSPSGSVRLPADVTELAKRTDRVTFETALARAEASNDPKLRKLAATARAALDELMERLINAHQAATLAKQIEQLQQQLAAAQARHKQLVGRKTPGARTVAHSPTTVTTDQTAARRADIRAWAARNGHDCPERGRIPNAVTAAYDEAHGGTQ